MVDSEPVTKYIQEDVCFNRAKSLSVALRQFEAHEDLVSSPIPSFAIDVAIR